MEANQLTLKPLWVDEDIQCESGKKYLFALTVIDKGKEELQFFVDSIYWDDDSDAFTWGKWMDIDCGWSPWDVEWFCELPTLQEVA